MQHDDSEEQHIKDMANLLRQGATLTELACPQCASPLFRLRSGDIWCAKCEKKVIVVAGEAASKMEGALAFDSLESTLMVKIQEVQDRLQQEKDTNELQKLGTALSSLLENLERTRRLKKI